WNTESSLQQQVKLPPVQLKIGAASIPSGNPPPFSIMANDEGLSMGFLIAITGLVVTAFGFVFLNRRRRFLEWWYIAFDRSHQLQPLKQACKKNDAVEIRLRMLSWARYQWPYQKVNGLHQVAEMLWNDEITAQLSRLDRALFSHDNSYSEGNKLWSLMVGYLTGAKPYASNQHENHREETHPPAYIKNQPIPVDSIQTSHWQV
ncbi:MAG: hypothetical protein AAF353_17110, partial [Pseudomonadota bacterium]